MVAIPSGSFEMGDLTWSGTCYLWEKPGHEVEIAVGKYEVAQDERKSVMGSEPE